jgi:uncharacterized protein GlcG (DUF336 family)
MIAEATLAECKAKGFNTAAAVVDRAGQVLVLLRDEQATAQVAEMARRKAYTARMFRTPTSALQKRTIEDPTYAAQRDIADVLALGGGMPIQIGTRRPSAASAARDRTQATDEGCAKARHRQGRRSAEIKRAGSALAEPRPTTAGYRLPATACRLEIVSNPDRESRLAEFGAAALGGERDVFGRLVEERAPRPVEVDGKAERKRLESDAVEARESTRRKPLTRAGGPNVGTPVC